MSFMLMKARLRAKMQNRTRKTLVRFLIPMAGFVVFCGVVAISEANYMKYKDPKQPTEARIKDLLRRMILAEKIGQMTQIERRAASPDVMNNYFIGSVLSGGGSVPEPKASAETWVNAVNAIQKGSLSTRLGIPMIYGIDAVHGHNGVYNATVFPRNVGLGVTRDTLLVKRIGAATALEVRATGIPYAFAPCIAVCRDPRWGRCYEIYSEDHKIVQMMTDIMPGLQGEIRADSPKGVPFVNGKEKVAACAKHFVGDGGTTNGINENNTMIDSQGLMTIHMPAYYNSIIKGVATIIKGVSYSSWNGIKMHANRDLITNFLKNKVKFKGFVISDWEGIDRITSPPHTNYLYSVQAGVSAGIDMIMVPNNFTEFLDILTYPVQNNIIPMSRIDDAMSRILRVKFVMGLFENPLADLSLYDQLGKQEHRDLAREAVRKSMVLLKNGKLGDQDHLPLPLPKKVPKILVARSHADKLGVPMRRMDDYMAGQRRQRHHLWYDNPRCDKEYGPPRHRGCLQREPGHIFCGVQQFLVCCCCNGRDTVCGNTRGQLELDDARTGCEYDKQCMWGCKLWLLRSRAGQLLSSQMFRKSMLWWPRGSLAPKGKELRMSCSVITDSLESSPIRGSGRLSSCL